MSRNGMTMPLPTVLTAIPRFRIHTGAGRDGGLGTTRTAPCCRMATGITTCLFGPVLGRHRSPGDRHGERGRALEGKLRPALGLVCEPGRVELGACGSIVALEPSLVVRCASGADLRTDPGSGAEQARGAPWVARRRGEAAEALQRIGEPVLLAQFLRDRER